jgi:dCTP deaminase
MLLADFQIRQQVRIVPFCEPTNLPGSISYGLSPYGYDVRLGTKFYQPSGEVLDPKAFSIDKVWTSTQPVILPGNSFLLAETFEYLEIPKNTLGLVIGKSTYDRCGVVINVGPLQPEWQGKITLEISNSSPVPVKLYPLEGIALVIFMKADAVCEKSYADQFGKYNYQPGLTPPKVTK